MSRIVIAVVLAEFASCILIFRPALLAGWEGP